MIEDYVQKKKVEALQHALAVLGREPLPAPEAQRIIAATDRKLHLLKYGGLVTRAAIAVSIGGAIASILGRPAWDGVLVTIALVFGNAVSNLVRNQVEKGPSIVAGEALDEAVRISRLSRSTGEKN